MATPASSLNSALRQSLFEYCLADLAAFRGAAPRGDDLALLALLRAEDERAADSLTAH